MQKNRFHLYVALLGLCLLALQSCKSNRTNTQGGAGRPSNAGEQGSSASAATVPADTTPFLVVSRAPCFGTCPIYNMNIYSDGKVVFQGIRFVSLIGRYQKQLSAEQIAALKAHLAQPDFFAYRERYDNEGISDLPSTTITYRLGNRTHKVFARANIPETFPQLVKNIESTINLEQGFMLIGE